MGQSLNSLLGCFCETTLLQYWLDFQTNEIPYLGSNVLNNHSGQFFPIAAAAAKSLQSCPTLCDPIDGSPPGSTIPGILQARTLQWVAISFSILPHERELTSLDLLPDSAVTILLLSDCSYVDTRVIEGFLGGASAK